MPLTGSLYVGTSGLQTSQNALNTTAHNITNADTKGYVRQQTMLGDKDYNTIAVNPKMISSKQLGLGVTYQQIRQVRDVFLDQTYREENARLSFYSTEYDAVCEVENLLGELDGVSFCDSLKNLWEAIEELSKEPEGVVTQGLLMQRANAFMTDAQTVYQGLCNYQDNLNTDIYNTVDTINEYGHKIWDLNEQIRKIETGGIEKANDLKDQRNQLLDELSGFAKIDYRTDPMGNVLVKIEGHSFVEAERVSEIGVQADETTGFYDVFWKEDAPASFDSNGIVIYDTKNCKVFDETQRIDALIDTDLGKLKAMVLTRGDHRANFTDLENIYDADGNLIRSDEEGYGLINNSVIMSAQAEFDRLIHSTVTLINGVLEEAFRNGDGTYMSDGNGNPWQIFCRQVSDVDVKEDYSKPETLFSVANLIINQELMQTPKKLNFVKADGQVDYETVSKLKEAFNKAAFRLNPTSQTELNLQDFYAGMVADVANTGAVLKSVRDTQEITVDSTESARQQIIGVSTDEELSNMIRYQNAYNASSRYINVISQMLEHLINTLGT